MEIFSLARNSRASVRCYLFFFSKSGKVATKPYRWKEMFPQTYKVIKLTLDNLLCSVFIQVKLKTDCVIFMFLSKCNLIF